MPEPIIVLALLAFGFIAGWVLSAAVRDRRDGSGAGPAPAPEAATPSGAGTAGAVSASGRASALEPAPAGGPDPAFAPEPFGTPDPAPAPDLFGGPDPEPPRAGRPDLTPASSSAPDLGRAVRGYEAVVDEWLDDDGQLDAAGRRSLAEFDAAVRELADADGEDADAVAALFAARELILERRGQALDAGTNRQLSELERAFT